MKYLGMGDPTTPELILLIMTEIAKVLDKRGWHLHTIVGDPTAHAFQKGSSSHSTIATDSALQVRFVLCWFPADCPIAHHDTYNLACDTHLTIRRLLDNHLN